MMLDPIKYTKDQEVTLIHPYRANEQHVGKVTSIRAGKVYIQGGREKYIVSPENTRLAVGDTTHWHVYVSSEEHQEHCETIARWNRVHSKLQELLRRTAAANVTDGVLDAAERLCDELEDARG